MNQPSNTDAARITPEVLEQVEDATAPLLVAISQQAVLPRKLDEGIYATLDEDGAVQIVETPGYKANREHEWEADHAGRPERVWRQVTVLDVASFADYLTQHTVGGNFEPTVQTDNLHDDGTLEVWADIDQRKLTGIIDGGDGWRKHTATLQLKLSREWGEWAAIDGKLLDQVAFSEFIEDHLSTIAEPAGATLLDICQTLQVNTNAVFKQQNLLANGQRVFRYEEATEAKAGQRGDLTIPGELRLVLRPFQGGDSTLVVARFRFQVREGVLKIGIKLAEPDVALERAFNGVVEAVQALVPVHVNHGKY